MAVALTASQAAALFAAQADSHGQLRRTPDGYLGDGTPLSLHSSRAVYALERMGLLEYEQPGLQSVVRITEGGRRTAAAYPRAGTAVAA